MIRAAMESNRRLAIRVEARLLPLANLVSATVLTRPIVGWSAPQFVAGAFTTAVFHVEHSRPS